MATHFEHVPVSWPTAAFSPVWTAVVGAIGGLALLWMPAGPALMLVLAGVVIFAMKQVTLSEFHATPPAHRLGYVFGWPGMDPRPFFSPQQDAVPVAPRAWYAASLKIALASAYLLLVLPALPVANPLWFGLLGQGGLMLLVFSGVFHVLALLWQWRGVPVQPIMNSPLRATSLSEFWGRRWNLAFRDFAHRHVFRPLVRRTNSAMATAGVFVVSGLVHDLVISGAARGGYGLPTLYFLIQGAGVLWERTRPGHRMAGRVMTALFVLVPAPLLFHRPYAEAVILPLLAPFGIVPARG